VKREETHSFSSTAKSMAISYAWNAIILEAEYINSFSRGFISIPALAVSHLGQKTLRHENHQSPHKNSGAIGKSPNGLGCVDRTRRGFLWKRAAPDQSLKGRKNACYRTRKENGIEVRMSRRRDSALAMQGTSSSQSVETISMFQAGGPDP
jgi:hypothetical protein